MVAYLCSGWALAKLFGPKPEVAQKVGKHTLLQAMKEVKGIKAARKSEFGDHAELIIKLANDEKYDLIVVGNRGLKSH